MDVYRCFVAGSCSPARSGHCRMWPIANLHLYKTCTLCCLYPTSTVDTLPQSSAYRLRLSRAKCLCVECTNLSAIPHHRTARHRHGIALARHGAARDGAARRGTARHACSHVCSHPSARLRVLCRYSRQPLPGGCLRGCDREPPCDYKYVCTHACLYT